MNKQKKVIKDSTLQIRISSIEKEKIQKEAEAAGMDVSTFMLSAAREKIRGKAISPGRKGPIGDLQGLEERLDRIEKQLQINAKIITSLEQISTKEEYDLEIGRITEIVYWMLQQPDFQKRRLNEIQDALLKADPDLKEFLKPTMARLYTPLDLALKRMKKEGKVEESTKGYFSWTAK